MITEVQRAKFEEFAGHPLHTPAVALMLRAIEVAALARSGLGSTWGVTVCPDKNAVFRINLGNYALLSVHSQLIKQLDPDTAHTYIQAAVIDKKLGFFGAPRGFAVLDGFLDHVEDSSVVVGRFDQWADSFFDVKKIRNGFVAHASQGVRRLPNPKWHNPATEVLLLSS